MISFVAAAACCFQRQSLSEHRLYIKDGKAALMSPIDWLGLNVKLHLAALKPEWGARDQSVAPWHPPAVWELA